MKNAAVRLAACMLLGSLAACGSGGGSSPAPPPAVYNPCPNQGNFSWQGSYVAEPVTFPSIPLGESPPFYDPSTLPPSFSGTILRPADTTAYPGARPAVVLQHGHGGNQCGLWYMARALAGDGYVTITYTQPYNEIPDTEGVDFDAIVSAIDFLGSSQNPYYSHTDSANIGVVGYSEGSSAASYVPQLPEAYAVHAAVALDNLKHWLAGDAGAPGQGCIPPAQYPVTPTVPTLGFAMDLACPYEPQNNAADIKETGWSWWQGNGLPSIELVMRGYAHGTFTNAQQGGGTSEQLKTLAYFAEAWFDRWLNGNYNADGSLLACSVYGQATANLLSENFLSGAFLAEAGVNTSDYLSYLTQNCQ